MKSTSNQLIKSQTGMKVAQTGDTDGALILVLSHACDRNATWKAARGEQSGVM